MAHIWHDCDVIVRFELVFSLIEREFYPAAEAAFVLNQRAEVVSLSDADELSTKAFFYLSGVAGAKGLALVRDLPWFFERRAFADWSEWVRLSSSSRLGIGLSVTDVSINREIESIFGDVYLNFVRFQAFTTRQTLFNKQHWWSPFLFSVRSVIGFEFSRWRLGYLKHRLLGGALTFEKGALFSRKWLV